MASVEEVAAAVPAPAAPAAAEEVAAKHPKEKHAKVGRSLTHVPKSLATNVARLRSMRQSTSNLFHEMEHKALKLGSDTSSILDRLVISMNSRIADRAIRISRIHGRKVITRADLYGAIHSLFRPEMADFMIKISDEAIKSAGDN